MEHARFRLKSALPGGEKLGVGFTFVNPSIYCLCFVWQRRGYFQRKERTAMKNFVKSVKRFLASEDGPTAVEYAVMLALIIVVCLTAIQAVGTNASKKFNEVANKLT